MANKGFTKKDKELLKEFSNKLVKRLNKAKKEYGESYLKLDKKKYLKEIEEELMDIAGWSMMFWLKLKKFKLI